MAKCADEIFIFGLNPGEFRVHFYSLPNNRKRKFRETISF